MRTYEKYKESGIQWIGEIPEHWELTKLKYIGKLYSGLSGKSGDDFKQEDSSLNKPFIPFTNIANNEKINPLNMQYVVINEDDNQNKVQKNDLFFMMSSENFDDVGKSTILVDDIGEVYLNSFCKGFRISNDNVCAPFLNYLLLNHASRRRLMIEANGFTRINLKMEKVNDFEIELPPLSEQTTIANYLDSKTTEIDQIVANKEALVSLYEEEKKALINEAVTKGVALSGKLKPSGIDWLGDVPEHWEVKKLKYVGKINPTKDDSIDKNSIETIVFLPMEKVKENGEIDCEIKKPISELWNGFTFFRRNDVIVAKITPCFENGKGALLDKLETEIGFGSTEFHVLRANQSILPMFLYFITKTEIFMEIGEAFMTGAAGQKRVPTSFISEFVFALPPLTEQTAIVQYIESETANINEKINQIKQEIALLKEYRQALIFEAVTGKVRV